MYEEIYLVVEGPFIRNEYESILKKEGVTSRMSSSLYERSLNVARQKVWNIDAVILDNSGTRLA